MIVDKIRIKGWFWGGMLIAGGAITFHIATLSLRAGQHGSVPTSKRNSDAVFNYLLPVVYSSGRPVRLYYQGACPSEALDPAPFPAVKVRRVSRGKTGLDAVREIFQNDRNVQVAGDAGGIIRIWIGKVPTAILRTRLSQLHLDPTAQYNPEGAFEAILAAQEVSAAEESLGFRRPTTLGYSGQVPDKRLPHLPATLRNMSAEETLDKVAETWAGRIVVIYGACAEAQKPYRGRPYILDLEGQVAWPSDFAPGR